MRAAACHRTAQDQVQDHGLLDRCRRPQHRDDLFGCGDFRFLFGRSRTGGGNPGRKWAEITLHFFGNAVREMLLRLFDQSVLHVFGGVFANV